MLIYGHEKDAAKVLHGIALTVPVLILVGKHSAAGLLRHADNTPSILTKAMLPCVHTRANLSMDETYIIPSITQGTIAVRVPEMCEAHLLMFPDAQWWNAVSFQHTMLELERRALDTDAERPKFRIVLSVDSDAEADWLLSLPWLMTPEVQKVSVEADFKTGICWQLSPYRTGPHE